MNLSSSAGETRRKCSKVEGPPSPAFSVATFPPAMNKTSPGFNVLTCPATVTSVVPESWYTIPLVDETLLLAPEGMVRLTALKWTGASPSRGNLVAATDVRTVAGGAGGFCPAAGAISATA